MTLGLGQFTDMNDGGHVCFASYLDGFLIGIDQPRVVPTFDNINIIAIAAFPRRALEAHEQLGDVLLGDLVFISN